MAERAELQRINRLKLRQQQSRIVAGALIDAVYQVAVDYASRVHLPTPYHTSALSGAGWVQELLTGHPERIQNKLGVYRGTFVLLIKALRVMGLKSSCHVTIEEQLSIFLYTVVTGLPCSHVGER